MREIEEIRKMGVQELEALWEKKRDELVLIRQELDRKRGERIEEKVEVNFEEYVTE